MSLKKLQLSFYLTAFAALICWILYVGQAVILPIAVAVIAAYVLSTAADAIGRLPVVGRAPTWLRYLAALLVFVLLLALVVVLVSMSFESLVAAMPRYQANIVAMAGQLAEMFGVQNKPTWETIREMTLERLDLGGWMIAIVSSTASISGQLTLIVIYTSFLLAERLLFAEKLKLATGREEAGRIMSIYHEIHYKVGAYLGTKTLVNIILAAISYVIMVAIGIDFAFFWALVIGVLNYIPYIGSLVGVAFPVILAVAQFGAISPVLVALVLLTLAQVYVGNKLEPSMIGKSVNLSPFVVLVSLAFWSALWGLPGAILAIPMTSIIVIALAASPSTRPVAILMSSDGKL
ncbi:AI-2E family transporter [Aquibium sp. A9E412]|uniref:AI-2E family transporter n=1 Tax=Aquibium sp. A9E412 TaxID=2976767 RepID=UPI0025B075B1|nr:AI-2E family transporter [Aquibium sp. A9E412]MDN2568369.1 AI-2E family transporter [Aquibium sp. A9E412]